MNVNIFYHVCASCMVVLILFSCSKTSNPDAEFYNPDELKTYEFKIPEDTLKAEYTKTNATFIWGIDSLIIIMNNIEANPDSKLFSVYDINSDSVISSFGTVGKASNELLNVCLNLHFNKIGGRTYMCCYNMNGFEYKVFDLEKSIRENTLVVGRRPFEVSDNSYSFWYKEGKYFECEASSVEDVRDGILYSTPKFRFIDKHGVNTELKIYPNAIKGEDRMIERAYFSTHIFSHEQMKVVDYFGLYDIFNIIDLNTGKVIGVKGKDSYGFLDIQKIANDEEKLRQTLICYNFRCCCSKNYIFCYQYRCSTKNLGLENKDNKYLLVFDWEGNLITSMIIKEPLSHIAYNEDTKVLFGTNRKAMGEDSYLIKYDLSKYLK